MFVDLSLFWGVKKVLLKALGRYFGDNGLRKNKKFTDNVKILREKFTKMSFTHVNFELFLIFSWNKWKLCYSKR